MDAPQLHISIRSQSVNTEMVRQVEMTLERVLGINRNLGSFYRLVEQDALLYTASQRFESTSPLVSALAIYAVTLVLELFVNSGSAKPLLIIPLIVPLADLVGVSRQIAMSAFAFGGGFSNLVYPTNALLLIALSLTVIPYHKWFRWVLRLWAIILPATMRLLALAAVNK